MNMSFKLSLSLPRLVCKLILSISKYNFLSFIIFLLDACARYGGTCADFTAYTCENGQFQLMGASYEYLCQGWQTKNERCCMADNTKPGKVTMSPVNPGSATERPTSKPVIPPTTANQGKTICIINLSQNYHQKDAYLPLSYIED